MQAIRIAIQSLRSNRVRTGLTTLGIIIGVASITLVLSLGTGAQNTVRSQVQKIGNNIILIKPENTTQLYNPYGISNTTTLTETDLNSVKLRSDIAHMAPILLLGGTAKADDKRAEGATIVATTPDLAQITGLETHPGQFVDNTTSRDTATISKKLAVELYGTDQVLGRTVEIKGRPHVIIGVVKDTNSPINLSGVDLDRSIYVSYDNGKSFNQGIAQIQQLLITVKDPSTIDATAGAIDQTILDNHQGERDFRTLAGEAVAEYNDSFYKTTVLATAIVALVTLVVGGIGIMNIMLVGVSERTREIGIRKALGATNQHILGQFLVESLMMCVVGGIAGLAIAYGLAFALSTQLLFRPAINLEITLAGLAMAFVVGILFGLYPAVKASRKDPIESLRQYQ